MTYKKEDLETDIDWFSGNGVEEEEAKSYIKHILLCGNSMTEEEILTLFEK